MVRNVLPSLFDFYSYFSNNFLITDFNYAFFLPFIMPPYVQLLVATRFPSFLI